MFPDSQLLKWLRGLWGSLAKLLPYLLPKTEGFANRHYQLMATSVISKVQVYLRCGEYSSFMCCASGMRWYMLCSTYDQNQMKTTEEIWIKSGWGQTLVYGPSGRLFLRMTGSFLIYLVRSGGVFVNFVRRKLFATLRQAVILASPILSHSVYSLIILSGAYIPQISFLRYS